MFKKIISFFKKNKKSKYLLDTENSLKKANFSYRISPYSNYFKKNITETESIDTNKVDITEDVHCQINDKENTNEVVKKEIIIEFIPSKKPIDYNETFNLFKRNN